jgi:hypothetical protein
MGLVDVRMRQVHVIEGRWRGTVPLRMVSGLRVGDGQLNFVSGSRRTDEVIKWT